MGNQIKILDMAETSQGNYRWSTLFKTFVKIGVFTLGGGYAMIPTIEAGVVDRHKWIGKDEFPDLTAIAQSCPGVLAVSISILIGYKLRGTWGATRTAMGVPLSSFLIILLIAMFSHSFVDVSWIVAMFDGTRPVVAALIAVPTFNLARSVGISLVNCWIPIISALLIWAIGVNPAFIIIAAGVGGYTYGQFIKPTE